MERADALLRLNGTFEDDVVLEQLRRRTSEKWTTYPADVLPAFVAETDFALAPAVREALQYALDGSDCGYAGTRGLASAFAHFARERYAWEIGERNVFLVPDVMAGVTESLLALTDRGARIAINPPVYPPFFEVIRAAERTVAEVPLRSSDMGEWTLDVAALEEAFANGVQAYLLCSPHNPVGRVWGESELRSVAQLAHAYNVAIISDEIHAPLTLPGAEFVPIAHAVSEQQRWVALASATKAWNVAGLKCGLMIAGSEDVRERLADQLSRRQTEVRWRVGQFGAIASIAAFRDGGGWLDALRAHLDGNRHYLAKLLEELIPELRYTPPEATYLAWVDCSALDLGPDPAKHFLKHGRVALEHGYKFGAQGEGYVRINMGTSRAILTEIVRRMASALKS